MSDHSLQCVDERYKALDQPLIGVTGPQRDFLVALDRLTRCNCEPPTYRELTRALGLLSPAGIYRLSSAMEDSGMIRNEWFHRRGLRLTGKGHRYIAQLRQARDGLRLLPSQEERDLVRAFLGAKP